MAAKYQIVKTLIKGNPSTIVKNKPTKDGQIKKISQLRPDIVGYVIKNVETGQSRAFTKDQAVALCAKVGGQFENAIIGGGKDANGNPRFHLRAPLGGKSLKDPSYLERIDDEDGKIKPQYAKIFPEEVKTGRKGTGKKAKKDYSLVVNAALEKYKDISDIKF